MANPDKFIRLRDFAKIMRALRETDVDGTTFHYDESKHEYANVKEFYSQHRSGRIYGVQFPRYSFSHVPTGAKTHDNANLSVTVSTAANAGRRLRLPQRLPMARCERHRGRLRRAAHHRHRRGQPIPPRRIQRRRVRHGRARIFPHRRRRQPHRTALQRRAVRRLRTDAGTAPAGRHRTPMPAVREIRGIPVRRHTALLEQPEDRPRLRLPERPDRPRPEEG